MLRVLYCCAKAMATFAELEIAIERPPNEKDGYPVVLRLYAPKSDQDERFPQSGCYSLKIDLDELHNLRGEDAKYQARLSEVFFKQNPEIQAAFNTARDAAKLCTTSAGNACAIAMASPCSLATPSCFPAI